MDGKNFDVICEEIREKIKKEADEIQEALKDDIHFDRSTDRDDGAATIPVKAIIKLIKDHNTIRVLKRSLTSEEKPLDKH